MIILNQALYVGSGTERVCYRHPDEKRQCIKLNKPGKFKQSKNDLKYYKRLHKRGISWEMMPKYLGMIDTNLGRGQLYELILDHDGEISQNIYTCLNILSDATALKRFNEAIERFKQYLLDQLIIVRDISLYNILCQKMSKNEWRRVIIDGVGNAEGIPISNYVDFLARRKIRKKLLVLDQRMKAISETKKSL